MHNTKGPDSGSRGARTVVRGGTDTIIAVGHRVQNPRRWWALALLVLSVVLGFASPALAGPPMIPPGQEQSIRELVRTAVAAAQEGDELPLALAERMDIHIDRDHFRVRLYLAQEQQGSAPEVSVHHPGTFDGEGVAQGGRALAPGVALRCADPENGAMRACLVEEAEPWRPLARQLERARAERVAQIWQIEERHDGPALELASPVEQRRARWALDRALVLLTALLGVGLAIAAWLRGDPRARPGWGELLALVGLVAAFVGASLRYTSMLPLHEHNSFLARSDCAIDPRCLEDPMAGWNLGSLNGYGLLLELLPHYEVHALASLSLGLSALALVLIWALARVLVRRLGHPESSAVAGLSAVAVWVCSPVAWRLASSASLWPYVIVCTLLAAWAAAWAGERGGDLEARPSDRVLAWLGWQLGALALVLASGGNFVLLILGACHGLAPLAWAGAWELEGEARTRSWRRLVLAALPSLAVVAWLSYANLSAGLERTAGEGVSDRLSLAWGLVHGDTLLVDARLGMRAWLPAFACVLAWIVPWKSWRGLRLFAPLLYLWLVPAAFLVAAAGEVIGSGYPVGFINHHWELSFSALAVGLGMAWLVQALEQRWPQLAGLGADEGRAPSWARPLLRWSRVVPLALAVLALRGGTRAQEAWTLATGSRVVERELVALERAFAELPPHELLILGPQLAEPILEDAQVNVDPLEVNFPLHIYAQTMRARGLEPARIVRLDRIDPGLLARLDQLDALIYVGSGLRSFQPHEIEAGAVPDSLERPELERLRETHALESVLEFGVESEQHEAISLRLGADRLGELELGFYRLHALHQPGSP